MNYFVDLIPTKAFINGFSKIMDIIDKNTLIVLNVYVKELPSNNINKLLYCDIYNFKKLSHIAKSQGYQINLMFDTSCFGNKEFSEEGKEVFNFIDRYMELQPDYVTITNNFFYNYIKNRYNSVKIILSEYLVVNNIQKINRYLELGCSGLKIDNKLIKNIEYISNNFDKKFIHIDLNKAILKDSIYVDCLNNSVAHYIQNEQFENASKILKEIYDKELLKGKVDRITSEDIYKLIKMQFINFWYYCPYKDEEQYIENLIKVISKNYEAIKQYPLFILD